MKTKLIITEIQLKNLKRTLIEDNEKSTHKNELSQMVEYDYDNFDRKQSGMDSDRKTELTNWAKDRQINNGVIVKSDSNSAELAIIPSDITISNNDTMKRFREIEAQYRHNDQNYTLKNYFESRGEISEFFLEARNSLFVDGHGGGNGVDIEISLHGKVTPTTDKDWPKLRYDVSTTVLYYRGAGRLIPVDRKGANILIKKIKELFLEKYGKFTGNGSDASLFIPEINIHPNTLTS